MKNKLVIILLVICVVLVSINLYQFNRADSEKTIEQSHSDDNSKYLKRIRELELENNLLKNIPKQHMADITVNKSINNKILNPIKGDKKLELIKKQYSPLFKELYLSEEDQEKLTQLLVERSLLSGDKRIKINNEITNLLNNPEYMELFHKFRKHGLKVNRIIEKLNGSLDEYDLPKLTQEQSHQLTMLQINDKSLGGYPKEDFFLLQDMKPDERADYRINQFIEQTISFNESSEKVLDEARALLSHEQYELFHEHKEDSYSFYKGPVDFLQSPEFKEQLSELIRE